MVNYQSKRMEHIDLNCPSEAVINSYQSFVYRALDKREYLEIIMDNFCLFCIKTYVVTPHLNRLVETVQMRGHNICFLMRNKKKYYHLSTTPSYLELWF